MEGVEIVVHLLQAQYVGLVGEDLLQDQTLPLFPLESFNGALYEVVLAFSKSCREKASQLLATTKPGLQGTRRPLRSGPVLALRVLPT